LRKRKKSNKIKQNIRPVRGVGLEKVETIASLAKVGRKAFHHFRPMGCASRDDGPAQCRDIGGVIILLEAGSFFI